MKIWHYVCKNEIDESCPFMPGFRYIVREAPAEMVATHMNIDGVFMDCCDSLTRSIRNIDKETCAKYLNFIKKVC